MATYTSQVDRKRFYVTKESEDGNETFPITLIKGMVIITTKWGDKIVFTKTNRGANYRDSREPKKSFSELEIKSELSRLLDTEEQAEQAFNSLKG